MVQWKLYRPSTLCIKSLAWALLSPTLTFHYSDASFLRVSLIFDGWGTLQKAHVAHWETANVSILSAKSLTHMSGVWQRSSGTSDINTHGLQGISHTSRTPVLPIESDESEPAPKPSIAVATTGVIASSDQDQRSAESPRMPMGVTATGVCEAFYDGVVFCLLLSYMPTPEQRFAACEKAHRILRDGVRIAWVTNSVKGDIVQRESIGNRPCKQSMFSVWHCTMSIDNRLSLLQRTSSICVTHLV